VRANGRYALAAGVLALGLGLWAWKRTAPSPRQAIAAAERAGDPVAEERDLLRGEVRRLGAENAALRARERAPEAALEEKAEAAAEKPRPERPTPEKEARWLMARAAFLDDVLAKQPRDEQWAAPLEERARTLAAGKSGAGVTMVSAACRSTACRMEFTYADADARMKHVRQLGGEFEELPRISYAYPGEPESHTRAIMYLAREDHPLPQLDYSKFAAESP
jgi:hypothetical protein